jgi:hypothetical protein
MKKAVTLVIYLCLALLANSQTKKFPVIDRIFTKVEYNATFKGGDSAWYTFLVKNLKPKTISKLKDDVMTKSVILEDGKNVYVTIENEIQKPIKKDIIRVLELTTDMWNPAVQNGHKVNAYLRKPINISILKSYNQE